MRDWKPLLENSLPVRVNQERRRSKLGLYRFDSFFSNLPFSSEPQGYHPCIPGLRESSEGEAEGCHTWLVKFSSAYMQRLCLPLLHPFCYLA